MLRARLPNVHTAEAIGKGTASDDRDSLSDLVLDDHWHTEIHACLVCKRGAAMRTTATTVAV